MRRGIIVLGTLAVAVLAVFLVVGRYEYMTAYGLPVRVDRLTGHTEVLRVNGVGHGAWIRLEEPDGAPAASGSRLSKRVLQALKPPTPTATPSSSPRTDP